MDESNPILDQSGGGFGRRCIRFGQLLLAAALLQTIATCAGSPPVPAETNDQRNASLSAAAVTGALRNAGLSVADAGVVEQPFFGVPAHVFTVDGEDLQVYEFANAVAAERAAATVAPDGGSIGATAMSWMAPPHFFRKDRVIVNYLGSSPRTLSALERILDPQFAGRR